MTPLIVSEDTKEADKEIHDVYIVQTALRDALKDVL